MIRGIYREDAKAVARGLKWREISNLGAQSKTFVNKTFPTSSNLEAGPGGPVARVSSGSSEYGPPGPVVWVRLGRPPLFYDWQECDGQKFFSHNFSFFFFASLHGQG